MTYLRVLMILILTLFVTQTRVNAGTVPDQQQPEIGDGEWAIGGIVPGQNQKLAQSFTVGFDGKLAGLRVPIRCRRLGGELLFEIRELDSGPDHYPTGRLRRSYRVPANRFPTSFDGFQNIYFSTPITVSQNEKLAFIVQFVDEGHYCAYAQSPPGNLYPNGTSYFGSPAGWRRSSQLVSGDGDLAFYTLMHAPGPDVDISRCVIPGTTDPATGLPVQLPISSSLPACRCFEDAGARELRCGLLHPDFFVIRQVPLPIRLGRPYEEIWRLVPLTALDGSVHVKIKGAGFKKPVQFQYLPQGKTTAENSATNFGRGAGKTFKLEAMAPTAAARMPGMAVFEYKMKDAKTDYLKRFGLDITLEKSMFEK